ncbi:MAG: PAS domain-containing protein [Alkalinema sp. CAN_BIN05]|nr:PAS domain-containing protein [Alkalinema sp. CAN_BIN05]
MTLPTYSLLIVDQSSAVREQYQCDLQANSSCNYQWLAATSIAEGVELCRTSAIDVVLLGESFGNINGLTFLEALSDRGLVGRPSVVMITATVDASVAVRAIKLGAEDYLVKPVTPERLQSAVQSAIETARSQADRQSEAQIRRILDGLFSFVGIMTPDGTLIEANRTALEAARLTPEDVLGVQVPDTYWWSYDAAIQAQLWTAIHQAAAGVTVRYDVLVRLAADHFITIDFALAPLFDAAGRVEFLLPSGIDITDRKRAEASLKDSMGQIKDYVERMTLALDSAKMASWYWDLTTGEITWSSYYEILWGYQPGTPNRRYEDWSRRVHPDDLPRVEAAIQMARQTQTDFLEEYRVIWADGTLRWVASFGRWYFNNEGEPYRMMGTVQDITDRKEMEASLDLSEEQLRLATEAVDLGMWFWNLTDDRLVWTAGCKRLFGLDADTEITYERFLAAIHPDDCDRTHAAVQRAINQKTEYASEYRTVWSDQSTHWILAQARTFYDDQDQPIRMIGTAQDITVRKQADVILQTYADELSQINTQLMETTEVVTQRNQELDQYAHIVSHDLKAPLRAIANLSKWIEEDLEGTLPANIQEQMTLLRSQVYRMESLITGLLDYARVGSTGTTTNLVSVGELLLEVIATSMPLPTFSVTFDPNLPIVYTKRLLLSQVFSNLIGNAIKHHDRVDGSVHISATDRGNFYEFAIADDGPGIAREYQDNIFTIFQTASPKNKKDSTGIGLAIVRKIVETEGGAIWLESQVGQGTKFYFTWPK